MIEAQDAPAPPPQALVDEILADPTSDRSTAELRQIALRSPTAGAVLLEQLAEEHADEDPHRASRWLTVAAALWSDGVGDAKRAARALRAALDLCPTDEDALAQLTRLYRDNGKHRALVRLLERRAEAFLEQAAADRSDATDPSAGRRAAEAFTSLGHLLRDPPLESPTEAIAAYNRAIATGAATHETFRAARDLYLEAEQSADALPLFALEREATADPADLIALYREEASARKLAGDHAGASALLRLAQKLDPDAPALAEELWRSIAERIDAGETVLPPERAEAAQALANVAAKLEATALPANDLAGLKLAFGLAVRALTGTARATELVRQAEVLVGLGAERPLALRHAEPGLPAVDPAEVGPLLDRLVALAGIDQVIDLHERLIARTATHEERALSIAAATRTTTKASAHHLERFFANVTGVCAGEPALSALERLAREGDAARGGVSQRRLFAHALAVCEPEVDDAGRARAALLRRAAQMARRDLGDPDQAFEWLGDALFARLEGVLAPLEAQLEPLRPVGRPSASPGRIPPAPPAPPPPTNAQAPKSQRLRLPPPVTPGPRAPSAPSLPEIAAQAFPTPPPTGTAPSGAHAPVAPHAQAIAPLPPAPKPAVDARPAAPEPPPVPAARPRTVPPPVPNAAPLMAPPPPPPKAPATPSFAPPPPPPVGKPATPAAIAAAPPVPKAVAAAPPAPPVPAVAATPPPPPVVAPPPPPPVVAAPPPPPPVVAAPPPPPAAPSPPPPPPAPVVAASTSSAAMPEPPPVPSARPRTVPPPVPAFPPPSSAVPTTPPPPPPPPTAARALLASLPATPAVPKRPQFPAPSPKAVTQEPPPVVEPRALAEQPSAGAPRAPHEPTRTASFDVDLDGLAADASPALRAPEAPPVAAPAVATPIPPPVPPVPAPKPSSASSRRKVKAAPVGELKDPFARASTPPPAPAPSELKDPFARPSTTPPVATEAPIGSAPPPPPPPPIELNASVPSRLAPAPPAAASRPRPHPTLVDTPAPRRVSGEELIADLFQDMHELDFCTDSIDAATFTLSLAMDKLGSDVGIVHLYDIDRREFVAVRAAGPGTAALTHTRTAEGEPLAAEALRTRGAVIVRDAANDPRASAARWETLRAALGRPLACIASVRAAQGGRFLGLIELGYRDAANAFEDGDEHALSYIAERFTEFVAAHGVMLGDDS
jgi:hypothetical protein